MARRQIVTQFVCAPRADAGSLIGADVVGIPAGGHRTGKFVSVVERQGQIARRMAFAAMRERLCEIGASVPFCALRYVGLKPTIFVEKRRPDAHQPALIVWKA